MTHDQEEALSMADRLVVLRNGQVQQIGTPEELHTQPANWHVAGFMGFRNLFELDATRADSGGVVVEGRGLRLTGAAAPGVSAGEPVVVGVRPEDIEVLPGGPAGAGATDNSMSATVEVVEYHGREFAVEARTSSGAAFHLKTPERVAPGDEVTLAIPSERLLVFPRGDERPPAPALADAQPSLSEVGST
ncbi:MAG: TOBE domain-containing protein [Intrasporangium sp.]|uniref:TOBE domain-containing protein n=1 Tax=Intrasporangium sp. TaxID=1925024 RepID=UPI003F7E8FC5